MRVFQGKQDLINSRLLNVQTTFLLVQMTPYTKIQHTMHYLKHTVKIKNESDSDQSNKIGKCRTIVLDMYDRIIY